MPKINSLEVVHQDTNADSYDNLHDLLVKFKKFYDESAGREVVDGEARAAYEVLMEMYVNDKEAFARRIETLTAKFGNSLAQVIEEMLAYASATEAYAKKITTLSAKTENQYASVKEYAEAVASEVSLKITTYSQDTAPTGNLSIGDLWYDTDDNNKLYRWNGLVWVATDDTRIAKTYARWGVQVDANGNIAGIQLNADDTGTSEFTVLADNFRVYKSGSTSDPIFTVGNVGGSPTVGIKGTLLLDSSVGTSGIVGNAVTVPVTASETTPIAANGGYISIISITITNSFHLAMPVIGMFAGRVGYSSVQSTRYRVISGASTIIDFGNQDAVNDLPSFQFYDTVAGNSTKTYTVQWYGTNSDVTIYQRYVTVLGVKK